jgi:hypothetical protein
VYLQTNLGFGLVHTQDVSCVAEAIEAGLWSPQAVQSESLASRYAYVPSPQGNKKAGH